MILRPRALGVKVGFTGRLPVLLQGPRLLPELRGPADDGAGGPSGDEVLPWVPVRQWVLTVPYRLRYQLAWDHGLSRAVLRVYTRALLDVYRRGARARGIDGGQTGMVTALQRAGGAVPAAPAGRRRAGLGA